MGLFELLVDIPVNPKYSKWASLLFLVAETVLCGLIIRFVPYTEIDWSTYMQQVELFLKGERDYSKLEGNTGPLVYPALHVYIYSALYYLTDHGTSIIKAQIIFGALYLVTLSIVFSCYRKVGAPPYLLIPLVLSKRLHSIFLLRLFNDGWATFFFWLSIWFFQRKHWALGAMSWSAGVGVKMTLLLVAPVVGAIVAQGAGIQDGVIIGAVAANLQFGSALAFLVDGFGREYFTRAFQMDRQFLYKWTVNWKFLSEEFFLSKVFSVFLLAYHAVTVGIFLNDRWLTPSSKNIIHFIRQYTLVLPSAQEKQISDRITPKFVMESMLGSMVLGLLCARSLHYQFFAYLGWATPFLAWRTGLRPGMIFILWLFQELAWLTYPATAKSSGVVVACLAIQVLGIWFSTGPSDVPATESKDGEKVHVE